MLPAMRLSLRPHAPATLGRAAQSVVLVLTVLLASTATGCAADADPHRPLSGSPTAAAPDRRTAAAAPALWSCAAACVRWRPVLNELDAHRALAYATGRPRLLRRVYVPGARIAARDRRMLTAWTARNATVSGVRLRVLDARRLPHGAARPGRRGNPSVRLHVVDQLEPAVAHLHRGAVRVPLPRDLPTSRVIVLQLGPTGWRIASAR
jgi:hypothetical protein